MGQCRNSSQLRFLKTLGQRILYIGEKRGLKLEPTTEELIAARSLISSHHCRHWTSFEDEDSLSPGFTQSVGYSEASGAACFTSVDCTNRPNA